MSQVVNIRDLHEHEIAPGFHGRFVHSDTMTIVYWRIESGSVLPLHSHHHEQIVNVIEGEFELLVDRDTYRLGTGDTFVLGSDVPHGGTAVTECRIIDVFQLVREDYQFSG